MPAALAQLVSFFPLPQAFSKTPLLAFNTLHLQVVISLLWVALVSLGLNLGGILTLSFPIQEVIGKLLGNLALGKERDSHLLLSHILYNGLSKSRTLNSKEQGAHELVVCLTSQPRSWQVPIQLDTTSGPKSCFSWSSCYETEPDK